MKNVQFVQNSSPMPPPTDWTALYYEHYIACPQCSAPGPDLCLIGRVMVQFAGVQRHDEYMKQVEAR